MAEAKPSTAVVEPKLAQMLAAVAIVLEVGKPKPLLGLQEEATEVLAAQAL